MKNKVFATMMVMLFLASMLSMASIIAPAMAYVDCPNPSPPATPSKGTPPPDPALFSDDFQDGVEDGWCELSGTWAVELEDVGPNYVYKGTATGDEQISYALAPSVFGDFLVEAKVKAVNDAGHFGIILREDGTGRHYGFYLNAYPLSVGKYYFGYWHGSYPYHPIVPWTDTAAYSAANVWNTLKVIARGYYFELYINDVKVTTVTDANQYALSGYVGCIVDYYATTGQGQQTHFDDIKVKAIHYDVNFVTTLSDPTKEVLVKEDGTSRVLFQWGDYFAILDNDADVSDGDEAIVQIPTGFTYDLYDQPRGKPKTEIVWWYAYFRSKGKPVWYFHIGDIAIEWFGGETSWMTYVDNSGTTNLSTRWYPTPV